MFKMNIDAQDELWCSRWILVFKMNFGVKNHFDFWSELSCSICALMVIWILTLKFIKTLWCSIWTLWFTISILRKRTTGQLSSALLLLFIHVCSKTIAGFLTFIWKPSSTLWDKCFLSLALAFKDLDYARTVGDKTT